jgi:hypothetical protein
MTSTQLISLSVGVRAPHSDVPRAWLTHNLGIGRGVLTAQNVKGPIARFLSVCCTALTLVKERKNWTGCQVHIKKAEGATRDDMKIVSVDAVHTCSREDSQRSETTTPKRYKTCLRW